MNELTKEDLDLLARISRHLTPSDTILAMYITPSDSLRRQADAMDQKEMDIKDFNHLLYRLTKPHA